MTTLKIGDYVLQSSFLCKIVNRDKTGKSGFILNLSNCEILFYINGYDKEGPTPPLMTLSMLIDEVDRCGITFQHAAYKEALLWLAKN